MSPLQDPDDLEEATRIINSYAASDWLTLSFSKHGTDQKQQRIIPHDVIMMTLVKGKCVGVRREIKGRTLRHSYEVEMKDQYGRVTVVTAVPGLHRLLIVTAYTDIKD